VVDDQLEQKEIVSLIAYLQALGKKGKEPVQAAAGQ
jgi:cbb3-type cytochrome oxidase cytochrome c subunit